ncbi:MAG: hypothetical protein JWP91_1913 [Fibrobacteres bacterium]|nr:hypothetical protein [Fibrobacterota bacterium]
MTGLRLPPISHRPSLGASVAKSPEGKGGMPAISAPTDPKKLPNGPNQLAGLLERAPAPLKVDTLHLQDRPREFHQGAKATRMINGKEVAISAPILGMKLPAGDSVVKRGAGSGAPAPPGRLAIEGRPSASTPPGSDTRSALEGLPSTFSPSKPDTRLALEGLPSTFSPFKAKAPAPEGNPSVKNGNPERDFHAMHLFQNNTRFVQHVHAHPPAATPFPATEAAQARTHAQAAPQRTNDQAPDAHHSASQGPDLPEGGETEKKMGMGKKVAIGIAAALGLTFILPGLGGSSTPPPGGQG